MNLFSKPRMGASAVQLLMRNLAVTLRSGVGLSTSLKAFEKDAPKKHKAVLTHLRSSVEHGNSLADAIESSPKAFPAVAINLVRTGEMSGTLPESLDAVSSHLKSMQELKRKIRSAMMYPTFVFVAVIGLGISVGTLVLPKLVPLFESLDVELPWTTELLLLVARMLDTYGFIIAAGTFLLIGGLFSITRMEWFKPYWHSFLLRIPYIGAVQKQAAGAQIFESIQTLLASGIPLTQALSSSAMSTENRVFRSALLDCIPFIEQGNSFSEGLRRAGNIFPMMSTTLVQVGEETGTLTQTLKYLSEYFHTEVDYAVKNLTTALEPLLLIFVGLIVGGVVMAIITPIYNVTSSIR